MHACNNNKKTLEISTNLFPSWVAHLLVSSLFTPANINIEKEVKCQQLTDKMSCSFQIYLHST